MRTEEQWAAQVLWNGTRLMVGCVAVCCANIGSVANVANISNTGIASTE